jgi:hypothetical protein
MRWRRRAGRGFLRAECGDLKPPCNSRPERFRAYWAVCNSLLEVVMVRFVSAVALAVAIAFSGSIVSGTLSDAAAKGKPGICKKTTLLGKVKTWSCKTGQVCCGFPIVGYYGCGSKALGCLDMK